MNVLETIFTRRSIRSYTGELITEGQLKSVIRAGAYAPSAHNKQPWHFVVVRDRVKLESIAKYHTYAKMATTAGCAIIVCGDKEVQTTPGFLIEDCSAAIQNMLLAAHGIGLGAVWCGLYPITSLTKATKELLGIPNNIVPVGMVVVGNKEKDREVEERFDESKIHFDKW